jgi:hypothetical protein
MLRRIERHLGFMAGLCRLTLGPYIIPSAASHGDSSHHDYIPDSIVLEGEIIDVPEALESWVLEPFWILVEIWRGLLLRFIKNTKVFE